MKMKSISGLVCYVSDLDKTAVFYEALGFRFASKRDDSRLTAYVNWFWVEMHQKDDFAEPSVGRFVYIAVEDIEEFYAGVMAAGMMPETEIHDDLSGRREFMLSDPDGYKLVFFTKK
jgi:catechol 2,3-dioxygenase-like lactoylglutathione lyase family enzyme